MRCFTRWTVPFAVAALSSTGIVVPSSATAAPGWKPRPASYDVVVEKDITLKMSDGTALVADVYRPGKGGKAAPGRFPVIVSQTPYNKTLPMASMSNNFLVQRGYVQVVVDVRGTGGSRGRWEAFSPREQRDGKEIVEWASATGRP